jgi:hypothetical protein
MDATMTAMPAPMRAIPKEVDTAVVVKARVNLDASNAWEAVSSALEPSGRGPRHAMRSTTIAIHASTKAILAVVPLAAAPPVHADLALSCV